MRPQPNAGQQPPSKVDPSKLKVKRLESALNALGPEQSAARACLEEVLKKAKTEGSTESRDTTSRPPEASLAEANSKMVRLQGSLAALGPDDIAERRVLEDALAKVRARAIVAPVGQRLDECEKFCERAAKRVEKARRSVEGSDEERGGVGGGEASFGSTPSRSCSPPSSAACRPRDQRGDASEESCCPVGRRFEAEPPISCREDFSGDQSETTSRGSVTRGGSIESSCAWSSIWFSCYRDGVGASRHVRVCVDVEFDRRGRQETSSSEWWWAVKWHKSVGASRSGCVGFLPVLHNP